MQAKREQKENMNTFFPVIALHHSCLATMSTPSFTVLLPIPCPRVLPLPLFSGKVAAGFPSPADDYVEKTLDLNELLVQKPAATFFVRAQGESMLGAGIHPNDILIVDRSIEPTPGKWSFAP